MELRSKKHTATSDSFNELQALRNKIKNIFDVQNVKWGGNWNGMNWENFSFYCTPETLVSVINFCKESELEIKFY
jgi:hypothetical protein